MRSIFLFLAVSVLAAESPMRLTVSVNDGSRLVGETSVREVALETPIVGKVTVPLDRIANITCAASQEVVTIKLKLVNGDTLSGRVLLASLPLKMAFAEVSVPLSSITSIQTSAAVAGEPVVIKNPQEIARKILNQARMLDAAIDQWALEKGRKDGDEVRLEEAATYLNTKYFDNNLLEGAPPKDLLGNLFLIGQVGHDQVKVHPKTKAALKDTGVDWGSF
jgi:hypothetical protein